MTATIRAVVGRYNSGMRRLMFTNGDHVFIHNPIDIKLLIDMAKVGKPDDLVGIKIGYHTLKYNVIDKDTMTVL